MMSLNQSFQERFMTEPGPLAHNEQLSPEATEVDHDTDAQFRKRYDMESILVIDDEPGICRTIQNILQNDVLRVLTATNPTEGLQLFRDESPHVVLLDIRLG